MREREYVRPPFKPGQKPKGIVDYLGSHPDERFAELVDDGRIGLYGLSDPKRDIYDVDCVTEKAPRTLQAYLESGITSSEDIPKPTLIEE